MACFMHPSASLPQSVVVLAHGNLLPVRFRCSVPCASERGAYMKASLVSATSLAALLAFEAGPALAGPTFDLSVSSAQSSCSNTSTTAACTLNFFALPGQASTTQTVVMTASK